MTDLFIDTSGWATLFDRKQPFHRQSVQMLAEALADEAGLVTTNLVLIELTALLSNPLKVSRPQQIQKIADVRGRPNLNIVFVNPQLKTAAWNLWQARADKTWSIVPACGDGESQTVAGSDDRPPILSRLGSFDCCVELAHRSHTIVVMAPNPYESPKEAGYLPPATKPAMTTSATLLAIGAFTSLLVGQLGPAFLPDKAFGFHRFSIVAVGIALAMFLANRADKCNQ